MLFFAAGLTFVMSSYKDINKIICNTQLWTEGVTLLQLLSQINAECSYRTAHSPSGMQGIPNPSYLSVNLNGLFRIFMEEEYYLINRSQKQFGSIFPNDFYLYLSNSPILAGVSFRYDAQGPIIPFRLRVLEQDYASFGNVWLLVLPFSSML